VLIQVAVDSHTSRLVISVALDNLGKGAAGQAIQNANLMCGLPQDTGLKQMGVK
jgi:N-acetyl-gamma-glutamyl-phosphate reductase